MSLHRFFRGGSKKNGKGKKGMKKESYDLIVNINLDEWKLTPEQEIFFILWRIDLTIIIPMSRLQN